MTGTDEAGDPEQNGPSPAGVAPVPPPYVTDTNVAIKRYLSDVYETAARRLLAPVFDRHAPDVPTPSWATSC